MSYLVAGLGGKKAAAGKGLGAYGVYGLGAYGVYGLGSAMGSYGAYGPDARSKGLGAYGVYGLGGPFDFLSDMKATVDQTNAQIISAAQQAGGAVKSKFGPKTSETQKSWADATNEIKDALEAVRRQAMVDGVTEQYDQYAGLVAAFVSGDLAQLTNACLAGDQLGGLTAGLKPRTDDVRGKLQAMAQAAVDRKMDPPSAGGASLAQSLSQLSNQMSSMSSSARASGLNPTMVLGVAAALALAAAVAMKNKKKAVAA